MFKVKHYTVNRHRICICVAHKILVLIAFAKRLHLTPMLAYPARLSVGILVSVAIYMHPLLVRAENVLASMQSRVGLPGPNVIKLFSCSTELSTKFILLINVKMPTIYGILTFISMINTTDRRLKARNFFICRHFSFYEQLQFRAPLS